MNKVQLHATSTKLSNIMLRNESQKQSVNFVLIYLYKVIYLYKANTGAWLIHGMEVWIVVVFGDNGDLEEALGVFFFLSLSIFYWLCYYSFPNFFIPFIALCPATPTLSSIPHPLVDVHGFYIWFPWLLHFIYYS